MKVACPQCNTEYLIVYPRQGKRFFSIIYQCSTISIIISGPLVQTLDLIERILNRSCPFLAGGILVGSVYWTAVTYGAVTIMQVREKQNIDDSFHLFLLNLNFNRFLDTKKA